MARREPAERPVRRRSARRARRARPRHVRAAGRVAADDVQGRLGRHLVAGGVRRPRRLPDGADHLRRGVLPRAGARPAGLLRHRHDRPRADRARLRGAQAALRPPHPLRRRHLVPGLLRAGRGLRSRGAVDPRRGPRRPLRRQWPEGVDLGRPVRGLDLSPRAHRSRGAPASRHQLSPGRHEDAGHQCPPARPDERAQALQRGLLRGRGGAEGESRRQGRRGLVARDDHAHVRAQGGRRARATTTRSRGSARSRAR